MTIKKIFLLGMVLIMSMIISIPVSAQPNSSSTIITPAYCSECTAAGIAYPKSKYSRSDFVGATIQYKGYTYYFWKIDENLTSDTHWWTLWYR